MLRLHSEARGEMENILSQHQCYTSACSADRTLIICLFILERVEDSCLSLTRTTEREDKPRSGCRRVQKELTSTVGVGAYQPVFEEDLCAAALSAGTEQRSRRHIPKVFP